MPIQSELSESFTDAYSIRIGIDLPSEPSLDVLDSIVKAHQCSIPFENLAIKDEGLIPSIELEQIFEKIVLRGRGGYCFELNALFLEFIRRIGYDAWAVSSCILRGKTSVPPMLHRGIVVEVGGTPYYCDVGYGGPQPAVPVPLGGERIAMGERFWVTKGDGAWWILRRETSSGEEENVLGFWNQPMDESYFVPYNFYCSTSHDSIFTRTRLVNIRTSSGNLSLTDNELVEHKDGKTIRTILDTEDSVRRVLGERFGIRIAQSSLVQ